jgi:hypothetical protein
MAKRNKKPKPMAGGVRIQGLCPATKGWRVLMLELDGEGKDLHIVIDDDDQPSYSLVDIACWALITEEDKAARYQDIWPIVPTDEGVMEPVGPEEPGYIGIVSPSESKKDIEQMVADKVGEFEGEEGGDDD